MMDGQKQTSDTASYFSCPGSKQHTLDKENFQKTVNHLDGVNGGNKEGG